MCIFVDVHNVCTCVRHYVSICVYAHMCRRADAPTRRCVHVRVRAHAYARRMPRVEVDPGIYHQHAPARTGEVSPVFDIIYYSILYHILLDSILRSDNAIIFDVRSARAGKDAGAGGALAFGLSLSLSLYMCIYIYRYIEREIDR